MPPTWVPYSPYRVALDGGGYWKEGRQWLNASSFNLGDVLLRWSKRDSALRWAVDPEFCAQILPLFPEARLAHLLGVGMIGCADLRAAIQTSIATWSANHPQIDFHDATDRCAVEACDVEMRIHASHMTAGNAGRAAYVQLDLGDVDWHVTTTSGHLEPGIGLKRGDMFVSRDMCWYLDATFCSIFHSMTPSVNLMVRGAGVLTIACCTGLIADYLVGLSYAIRGKVRPHYFFHSNFRLPKSSTTTTWADVMLRVSAYVAYIPMLLLLICIFVLIFVPFFYQFIFIPCVECYDFEATIAHEVGHLLGFQHPDVFTGMGLRAQQPMSADVCDAPFDHVELADAVQELSIMHSLVQHEPRTCLNTDDVEGLLFLYPRCERAMPPQCIKTWRYDGILRLLVSVAIPYMVVTILILLMQQIARRYYVRREARLEHENRALRRVNVRQKVAGKWTRAAFCTSAGGAQRAPISSWMTTRGAKNDSAGQPNNRLARVLTGRRLGGYLTGRLADRVFCRSEETPRVQPQSTQGSLPVGETHDRPPHPPQNGSVSKGTGVRPGHRPGQRPGQRPGIRHNPQTSSRLAQESGNGRPGFQKV